MATNQYNKRFLTKIRKEYAIVLPVMLVVIILFNNLAIDFYYKVIYWNRFRSAAEEVKEYARANHAFPKRPEVTVRKLAPGTQSYTFYGYHFREIPDPSREPGMFSRLFFGDHLNNRRVKEYVTTVSLPEGLFEIRVAKIELNEPGGPEREAVLFAVACSLVLFLLLNWGFFQFNLRRVSYNLWRPFYKNLRRVNSYHIRSAKPLQLVDTNIREFELFNHAILDFTNKTQAAYNQLREFTENTAHELQTPLSILLAKVELILKKNDLDAVNRKELLEIKKTIVRLSGIQKGLNLLSRIRSIQYSGNVEKKTLLITGVIHDSVETYEELIEYKGIALETLEDDPEPVATNEELIRILVDNLLRNAVQHNHTDGKIRIAVQPRGFEIANTGAAPEVPGENLFARYQTRSQDNGRLGLGLAIVEAICDTLDFSCHYYYRDHFHCIRISWER